MNPLIMVLIIGVICSVFGALAKARGNNIANKPQNVEALKRAEERIAAACAEGESLNAVCMGKNATEFYAVTDKRFILETNGRIESVPYLSIKEVKAYRFGGDKTKNPSDAYQVKVYADKTYSLYRYSDGFTKIAARLFYHGYNI